MSTLHARRLAGMLEDLLPDATVARELSAILAETSDGEVTTLMVDGETHCVPVNARIVVVTRALYAERYERIFLSGCRVQVAIGELNKNEDSIRAQYCFATISLDRQCKVIRTRFHRSMYLL